MAAVALAAGAVAWVHRGPPPVPVELRPALRAAAATCPGLDAGVLAAQLEQESGWDPRAVSASGAQGMAQFLPATWRAYAVDGDGDGVKDVWNPRDAIATAARFDCVLLHAVASVPGDRVRLMLAAYNAGTTAVRTYQGVPPYPETKAYVARVMARSTVVQVR